MAKSKFLKNLLTTASAVAVLAGGIQWAEAAKSAVTGNATLLGAAAGTGVGGVGGRVFQDSDYLEYTGNGFTLTTNAGAPINIAAIDVHGFTPGLFTVVAADNTTTLGAVGDLNAGVGSGNLNVLISAGAVLDLSGTQGGSAVPANDYSKLGTLLFGDAAATLNVAGTGANLALAGTLNGNGTDDFGILNVVNTLGNTATFTSTIGNTKRLAAVNVGTTNNEAAANGIAVFTGAVKSSVIHVGGHAGAANAGGSGTATFNGVGNIANAGFLVGGNANAANNGGDGSAEFGAGATLTITAGGLKVGGNGVGAAGAAGTGKIVFGVDANLIVTVGGITLGGAGGDANAGVVGTNGGAVAAGTSFGGTVLVSAGGLKIGGAGGAGSTANDGVAGGNGGSTAANATFVKMVTLGAGTAVNIGGAGGAGNAGAGGGAAGGNGGTAVAIFAGGLKADTLTVGGNAGANNTGNGGAGGAGTVTFNAALTNNDGTGRSTVTVGGTATGGAGGTGIINFDTNPTLDVNHMANVTFGTVASSVNIGTAVADGTVNVTGDFSFANKNASINLGNASNRAATIAGTIASAGGANGILNIIGLNTSVTGAVGGGAAATTVATINVGVGQAGKVTFGDTVRATNVNVASGAFVGEAVFNGAVTATTVTVGNGGGGVGTASFNVGDSATAVTYAQAGSIVNIGNSTAAPVKVTGNVDFANLVGTLNLKGEVTSGTATNKAVVDGNILQGANGVLKATGFTQVIGTTLVGTINVGDGALAGNAIFGGNVTAGTALTIGGGTVGAPASTATFGGNVTAANGVTVGHANNAVGHAIFNADTGAGGAVSTFASNNSDITIGLVGDTGRHRSAIGFAGKDATIIFGAGDTRLDGAVTTTTVNTGKIVINTGVGKTASILSTVGVGNAGAIRSITVAGNGSVTLGNGNGVSAAKLEIGGTGTTTVGDATLTVGDGTAIVGAGTGEGVVFTAAGTLSLVRAGGNAIVGLVDFAGIDGIVNLTAAGNMNGSVDNTNVDTVAGKLVFNNASTVTGNIGKTNALTSVTQAAGNAATFTKADGAEFKATNFKLGNAAAEFVFSNNAKITGNVMSTTGVANNGILSFGKNGEMNGTIGGNAVNNLSLLQVNVGTIGAGDLKFTNAGGTHYAKVFQLSNAASTITLDQPNTTIVGAIETANVNNGTLIVKNANEIIIGKIGTAVGAGSNASIKKIEFNAANGVDAALTVDGAGAGSITAHDDPAGGVLFTTDGTLTIKGAGAQTIATRFGGGAGLGAIELHSNIGTNNVVFSKIVGATGGNAIKSLTIDNGVAATAATSVDLQETANILTINLGTSNLKLSNAGNYKIDSIVPKINGTANLLISADGTTLVAQDTNAGANLGSEEVKLQALVFTANHTLNIGDGVNVYANNVLNASQTLANAISPAGGTISHGKLIFAGNSIFDATMTATDKVNTITGPGAGKEAKIMREAHTNAAIIIGAGTLSFGSSVNANGNILAAVDAAGTLKFINTADALVTGEVGAAGATRVKTIEFNGTGKVAFGAKVHAGVTDFKFTKDTATTVTFDATTLVGAFAVESGTGAASTIVATNAAGDVDFTKSVTGTNGVIYKLNTAGLVVAKITPAAAGDLALASFTTGTAGTNTVDFRTADATVKSIGEFGKNMQAVIFTTSGRVTGGTYSETITINDDQTGTFGGPVGVGAGDFVVGSGANGGTAAFADGFVLERAITTSLGGKSTVNFAGGATINKDITGTGFAAVNFNGTTADKIVALNKDIKATAITVLASTLKLTDADAALDGTTTATGTTFELADKTLKVKTGGVVLTGDVKMKTKVAAGGASAGNIKIEAGATNSLAGVTSLTVEIDDLSNNVDALTNGGTTFILVDNRLGTIAGAPLSVANIARTNTGSRFNKWTPQVNDKNTVSFTSADNTTEVLETILASSTADDKINGAIMAFDPDTRKELAQMNDATFKEAVERIVATDVEAVVGDVVSGIGSDISSRMGNLAGMQAPTTGSSAIVTSDATSGISAGDDVSKYGVWTTPFFNKSVQKSRKGAAGYAASTAGASFGFDTRANDDMIIGAALSFLNSDIKHKDYKSGDKTRVESLMFSIYGMQQITDNWFGQAVATFGSNRVKTNEKRVNSNTTSQTAEGKYTSMAFSGEALIGYNYSNGMVAVTPMGGIRATRINDGGYKETGTTNQNLTISKKASNKFELVLGARVSGGTFDLGGLAVTPEVHGFVNQDLIGKNPAMDMRLDKSTQSLATKRGKPNKTTYNMGVGMNANYNMMEYGLGYDAHLANKFVGHQGTLKVRVNF